MTPLPTLLEVPEGGKALVKDVLSPSSSLRRRLLEMGLVPGTEVEVLRNNFRSIVVRMRGSTIAIGCGIARRVFVEVVK